MDFLEAMSVGSAERLIKERFGAYPVKTRRVSLGEALGRVCAADLAAGEDIPCFDRSTMDGYAVRSGNTGGASESLPSLLNLVYAARMGENVRLSLSDGEACYVPTGAMLPGGADCVVMLEHTEKLDEHTVAVYKAAAPGSHIIRRGDDAARGSVLVKKGETISEFKTGILAAAGIYAPEVYEPPRAFVISTGDELIEAGEKMEPGKVRDVNGPVISAFLKRRGCAISGTALVRDAARELADTLRRAAASSDFVIISGGSSVGDKDYTYEAIKAAGAEVFIRGLSLKPGKPTIVGDAGGKAVFGLPGHPVSAAIVYKLLVDHYLDCLTSSAPARPLKAALSENIHSSPGKLTCQPVRLAYGPDGITAEPVYGQSGLISVLSGSDGFIKIPERAEGLNKGDPVDVFPL